MPIYKEDFLVNLNIYTSRVSPAHELKSRTLYYGMRHTTAISYTFDASWSQKFCRILISPFNEHERAFNNNLYKHDSKDLETFIFEERTSSNSLLQSNRYCVLTGPRASWKARISTAWGSMHYALSMHVTGGRSVRKPQPYNHRPIAPLNSMPLTRHC